MNTFETTLKDRGHPTSLWNPAFIRELDGVQGRPDLVVAKVRDIPLHLNIEVLARCLASPTKAWLLSVLRYGAPRRIAYLEKATGLPTHTIQSHIACLSEAGLIKAAANSSVSLACPLPWTMVDIVAYEGKLSNWRRALHQAITYRMFSASVQIVVPSSGASRAKQLETIFRNNGIGLIAVSGDGSSKTEIKSKKRRPRSRRLYLTAVGAILQRLITANDSLHSCTGSKCAQGIEPLVEMGGTGLRCKWDQGGGLCIHNTC